MLRSTGSLIALCWLLLTWTAAAQAQVSSPTGATASEGGRASEGAGPIDPPPPVDPPPPPGSSNVEELDSSSILDAPEADGPPDPPRARVCLLEVSDLSGRGSVTKLRGLIEGVLTEDPRLEVLPQGLFQLHARKLRFPRDRWLTPAVLPRIAGRLRLRGAITATLRPQNREYVLTLTFVHGYTGETLVQVDEYLSRPHLGAARAKSLLIGLITEALAKQEAAAGRAPAARAPGTTEPSTSGQASAEGQADGAEGSEGSTGEGAQGAEGDTVASVNDEWASAQEDWGSFDPGEFDATAELKAAVAAVELKWGGEAVIEHFSYVEHIDGKVDTRNSVELAMQAEAGTENVRAFGRFIFRKDFSEPYRDRIDVDQAYGEATFGPLTIQVGRLITNWGTTNLLNPTDFLNQRDYRDPTFVIKQGTLMARAALVWQSFMLEVYALPVPETHLLAVPFEIASNGRIASPSRWVVQELPLPNAGIEFDYNVQLPTAPQPAPENTGIATRLAASFLGVDLSLGYAYMVGKQPHPVIDVVPVSQERARLDVAFTFNREHIATIDFETAFGNLRLAGEAIAVITEDVNATNDDIDDPYLTSAVGADYRTPELGDGHFLHFFVDVTATFPLVGSLNETGFGRMRYPFIYALLGRVAYEWDDLALSISGIAAIEPFDWMLVPSVEYTLFERFKLTLSFQTLGGDPERGLLGRFHQNSRVAFRAVAQF